MANAVKYKNPYTLDGRIPFGPWVTQKKVEFTKDLVEKMLTGDRQAKGLFEGLITTSELSMNLAQLVNAQVLPQLDQTELVSDQIATVRPVSDFRNNYLYTLAQAFAAGTVGDAKATKPLDTLPIVPEGTPYPEFTFSGEVVEGSAIAKRGAGLGITWEAIVNDATGVVQAIPGLMKQLAVNTYEAVVFTALTGASHTALAAGTALDGATSPANAPLGRAALANGISQLKAAIRTNYNDVVAGGFNLVVPVGQGELANYLINSLTVEEVTEGSLTLRVSGYNPLGGITVIESIYVTGTAWYLIPKKGTTVRPVLDRLTLIGHEAAELRVENMAGQYVGGGQVSPFEGSFVADTGKWRVRIVTNAVAWSPKAILKSTGAGS